MKIEPGTRLGPYEVIAPIGAGGMGEVYRAHDSRLERSVAIKVMTTEFASNAQLKLRFEREAKTISQLNHPNICVLYDVGETTIEDRAPRDDGSLSSLDPRSSSVVSYLVMELLEGETLDERIRKGPLPLDDILRYGFEIAEALAQAHRQGIIHRDLKPSNIMITRSGAKLLDFGLSKLVEEERPAVVDFSGATEHRPITTEGTLVGTFQYMAPEQVEGKPADVRTDIFAFGAVLYEMLTGKRAFEGKSRASAIAAILASEPPPIASIRPVTPAALDSIVRICLEKEPDDRWQNAHDLKLELELVRDLGTAAEPQPVARHKRALPWIAAAVIALIAATAALVDLRVNHPEPVTSRFHIAPPEGVRFEFQDSPVAVSPDGSRFVFRYRGVAGSDPPRLWLRDASSLEMRPLHGTEQSWDAFWSWDGKQIGFFTDDKLKRIDANGGPVTTIAVVPDAWGGAWAKDGSILLGAENGPIQRYLPNGGAPERVTALDAARAEIGHRRPQVLPDGRHFLYLAISADADKSGVYAAAIDGSRSKRVLDVGVTTIHDGGNHLLYYHDGNLYGQKFDLDDLETTGAPFVVAEGVGYTARWESPGYSASRNGVLAYHPRGAAAEAKVARIGRDGKFTELADVRGSNIDLSRDDGRLAVMRNHSQTPDIWIYDLRRDVSTRLTFGNRTAIGPVWSPDGQRLVYTTFDQGRWSIQTRRSSGVGAEETLFTADQGVRIEVVDWSRDGRYLLTEVFSESSRGDLSTIDLTREPLEMTPFIGTQFNEHSGRFSADGQWIAYMSDESGQQEIYVQPFPPDGSRWQISSGGGSSPRWRADGRELLFVARERTLVSVPISTENGFHPSPPVTLTDINSIDYVITSDGEGILVSQTEGIESRPAVVILNWDAGR